MRVRRLHCAVSLRAAFRWLTVAASVAGCTVGPEFVRPQPPKDLHQYTAERPPDQDQGRAEGLAQRVVLGAPIARDWWQLFGSSELDRVVSRVLENNRTLHAASATLARANELVAAQAGAWSPQVSIAAGAGRQKYGVAMLGDLQKPPPFTYYSVGPTVAYALDYVGGTARAVERQAALASFEEQQADAAYLAVSGNAVALSLRIASLREQLATLETLLDQDRENLKLVREAFEAGMVSRLDVVAAESELAGDGTLLPPLRQELGVARHALSILAGLAPAASVLPEPDPGRISLPLVLPVSVPSELVHRRPDILAAEAQLHAATAAVGIAEANLYPRITLTASIAQQSTDLGHLFDRDSTAWGAAGNLLAPILDGGTLRAEKRATEDALRASRANYEQTVLEAFGQVADALEALEHDAEELDAQTHARETSQANVDLTRRSYAEGNVGVLQVLDAQRSYQRAQLGYVRAKWRRYLDTAQLYLALGGGGSPR
jgi:NodT family efflux transporter outer membrane factor (OMF) lipoprotein